MKKVNIFCALGFHSWKFGWYAEPVAGRYEKHCIKCPKKQFMQTNPKKWIDF